MGSEQKAVDKEKEEVAVLPTGSTPKAEGVLDVKKKEAKIKQEEEVVEGQPATPKAVDLPKKTQTFKEYGKSSQSACCNTNQEFEFLDLKGDGKKGFMASRSDCEKQCRNFNDPKTNKKCLFFEINPDASVDWCTGFSSCDRQCTVQYKRAHTIYQLGGIPLKPKKTNLDNKPVELAAKTKTPAPPGATSSTREERTKSDQKKVDEEKKHKLDKIKKAAENAEQAAAAEKTAKTLENEKRVEKGEKQKAKAAAQAAEEAAAKAAA